MAPIEDIIDVVRQGLVPALILAPLIMGVFLVFVALVRKSFVPVEGKVRFFDTKDPTRNRARAELMGGAPDGSRPAATARTPAWRASPGAR